MEKTNIVQKAEKLLDESNYVTSVYHGCFDIAAKREKILLVKILQNIDAMLKWQAKNLKIISENLDASPILVGEQTRVEKLHNGVVYERYGVPAVNFETFRRLVEEDIMPTIYSDRGGMFVRIDSGMLREFRNRRGLTQKELAEMVGINKKAIYEHEKEELRMVMEIAQKIEKILQKKLTKEIDVLQHAQQFEKNEPKDRLEKDVGSKLKGIGFKVNYVSAAPFDIMAREKALIISDVESNKSKIEKRAPALRGFSAVTDKPILVITDKPKHFDSDIPVIGKDELKEIGSSRQLLKIAKRVKR